MQKKVWNQKKHAREKNVITTVHPPTRLTPPMCLLVHVWAASERYHNQVGNIKFALSYGVANSAASLNYNPSQTVKNTKKQVNPTPKTNK